MKRVLRSCIDPLPRFLSTRGLLALVLLVLGGTGLSVHGLLQADAKPARSAGPQVRQQCEPQRPAAPARTPARFAEVSGPSGPSGIDNGAQATCSPATTASRPATLTNPGVLEPAGS